MRDFYFFFFIFKTIITLPNYILRNTYSLSIDELQKGAIRLSKQLLITYLISFIALSSVALTFLFNPFGGVSETEAAWFNDSWGYRKAITINESMVSGSSALTDFPVLVSLASDTALAANAQDDGDDIVFTSINGERLSHEIEKFDGATGELVTWVRVHSLAATTNTILYIYYGNPGSLNQQRPTEVWESSYQVVQHMEETSAVDTVNTDSSRYVNNAIKETANRPTPATGQIAGSQDKSISALGNDWSISNITPPSGTQDYTISFWVDPNNAGTYNAIFWGNNGSDISTFALQILTTSGRPRLAYNQSTILDGTTDMNGAGYYHVVLTRSGNTHTFYINGAAAGNASSSVSLTFSGTCPMHLVNSWSGTDCVNNANNTNSMALDEFKYALGTAKSADWIATEYNNQDDPGSYVTIASEQKAPAPVAYWKFDDAQGTTTQDSGSNNNDGTLSGTTVPAWQKDEQCVSGKCLFFDGSSSYVDVGTGASLNISGAALTISMWLRPIGLSGYDTVFANYDVAGEDAQYEILLVDGEVSFAVGESGSYRTFNSGQTLVTNKWQHLVIAQTDMDTVTVYIDGKAYSTTPSGTADPPTSGFGNTTIGRAGSYPDQYFHGFIDEVKLYNFTQTNAQVLANYGSYGMSDGSSSSFGGYGQNNPSIINGLLGYWKLDESSGNASDSSGNGTTLTNNSTTSFTTGKFGFAGSFVAASTDYFSTATTINGVKSVAFWTYNASTTDEYIQLTASAYITSSSGTLSATGFTNPIIYVDGVLNGTLSANRWNHVVVTTDTAINANAFEVGRANSTYNNGRLDEVRLYSVPFSNNSVKTLSQWAAGPSAYWSMNESTGNTLKDSSGNSNNSNAFSGNTSYTTGKYGGGLTFDGTNDYVTVTDASAIDVGQANQSFTVMVWIKRSAPWSADFTYFSKSNSSGTPGPFEFYTNNFGAPQFRNSNSSWSLGTGLDGTTDIMDNTWHHLAAVRDEDTNQVRLYVDGVLEDSGADDTAGVDISNNEAVYFGERADGNNDFAGLLDDAKIYTYARTQAQIIEDMNAGHPAPGSPVGSPIAYWKFDEGYSTTAYDSNSSTGGAENLTLSSASWTNTGKFGKAFNGTGGAIRASLADYDGLDFLASDDFSITLWFKSDSATNPTANQWVVHKKTNNGNSVGYATYFDTSGQYCFGIDDDTSSFPEDSVCTSTDYYDGNWHYFLAKKTGTTRMDIYVDGIANGTADTSISATGTLANAGTFYLADQDTDNNGSAGAEELAGDLDEVKIFRSALTEDQIKLDMNRGASQVLGTLSNNAASQTGSTNTSATQEYCIPGDSSTCTSPTGRWDFEENSGSITNESGSGTNCTMNPRGGSARWDSGKLGGAVYLNASQGDYWNTFDSCTANTFLSSSAGTIEGWIKPTSQSLTNTSGSIADGEVAFGLTWGSGEDIGAVVTNYTGTACGAGDTTTGPGIYVFNVDAGGVDCIGSSYTANNWYHIALTHTGGNLYMYKNGRLVGSVSSGNTDSTFSSMYMQIGSADNGFTGFVDGLRSFNYARSQAQISWDYNRGAPVAHWKMDECQGTTIYNSGSAGSTYAGTLSIGAAGETDVGTCTTSSSAWGGASGDSTTNSGKRNYALTFDGNDDDVTISSELGEPPNVTLAAWVNVSGIDTSGAEILSIGDAVSIRADDSSSNNTAGFFYNGTVWTATDTTVNISGAGWQHIVYTVDMDSDVQRIYLNGILRATTNVGSAISYNQGTSTKLGEHGNGSANYNLTGRIDDARVYGYALTEAQVKNLYNEGAVRFGPSVGAP